MLRKLSPLISPIPCVEEKLLPLSQKSLLGMGRAKHDPQESQHTICKQSTRLWAAAAAPMVWPGPDHFSST